MAYGRDWSQWWHTASLMAFQANLKRDPKKQKPFRAIQFHAYECRKAIAVISRETMDHVVAMFVAPERAAKAVARAEAERELAQKMARERLARMGRAT